jgi:hypothetical protein
MFVPIKAQLCGWNQWLGGGVKWLGLLGEGAYMVGCLLTWIGMVVVIKLGKI